MKYLGFKSVLNEYKQTYVKASKLCQAVTGKLMFICMLKWGWIFIKKYFLFLIENSYKP